MRSDFGDDFVLRVDKAIGPTSHDVVTAARRALHTRRIGHTGTLDPFASGLLLICVNRATRIAEFLTSLDKTYVATARLDGFTTTDDCTGERIETFTSWTDARPDRIEAAMETLTGSIEQVPPAYSAKKLAGQRSYDLARRGESVNLAPVRVVVHRFALIETNLPELRFEVDCSSGTYVRALARDLGRALGTGGYLTALRRTRIGSFGVEDAVSSNDLNDHEAVARASHSALAALAHLPRLEVPAATAVRLRLGQAPEHRVDQPRSIVVVSCEDELVAIAREDGASLRPVKVWSTVSE